MAVIIRNADQMTEVQARYWNRLAKELEGVVDVIDPWRVYMTTLRQEYPAGTRVYRASTGGRWGRSAERVTL